METYSGKRSTTRVTAPRKGPSVNLKDRADDGDQHGKFCKRIGCSGRIKYSQDTTIGTLNKAKCAKPSSCSENAKERIKNPSRTCSTITSAKKYSINPKSSRGKLDSPESSISSKSEVSETGSSSGSSTDKSRKVFHRKSESTKQNAQPTSPVSPVPKSTSQGACSSGLRNLKCNSVSDVMKSSGKEVMKKRSSEGESSSSSGWKKMNGGASFNGRVSRSTNGISISDSRRGGYTPGEDLTGASSVRTQRSNNGNTRTRLSNRHNGNISSLEPPADFISRFSRLETPGNVDGHVSSPRFSVPVSSSSRSSYSLSSNNDDALSSSMPSTGFGTNHLLNHNMDGVAEILLALERIRHEEPLNHEHLLALESNLIISGLNLYDQHRDMRLDIDNMSYEELLALEECMGTVSTAVSEEELSKCLVRCIYHGSLSDEKVIVSNEDGDDIKCSICQEEYELGDEIGKMVECQHGYHVTCIQQWLRLKNWCPICKASAVPS